MSRHDGTTTQHRMNSKANLVLISGLLAFAAVASAQVSETLPSPARADKTGPAIPSMANPGDARGSVPAQAAQSAKPIPAPRPALPAAASGNAGSPNAARTSSSAAGVLPPDAENLNTTALGEQIRAAAYADRDKLFEALGRRLAAIDLDVDEVRRTAPTLTGEARSRFNLANKEFKAKKRQFEYVLGEARKAKPDMWEAVRNALANEYETYSVAVTRIEGAGAFGR